MLVDAHVHVWSEDAQAYPWQPMLAHVPIPSYPATAESLIAEMDAAGVSHAVLVQPSVYGGDNRYLVDCLKRWPDRFVGICHILQGTDDPQRDVERWCGNGGCQGVRVNIIRQPDSSWLAAADQDDFWRALEALDLAVSMHMELDHAPLVALLAARHRRLRFLVEYLGADVYRRNGIGTHLDTLAEQPNVFFKLICAAEDSAHPYPFPDLAAFYGEVLKRFGASRVMFGSDFPGVKSVCTYAEAMNWPHHLDFLSDRDREQIFARTPAMLWNFG
jgi:predicted TIM-barrel fold metal-dependent hydrolase